MMVSMGVIICDAVRDTVDSLCGKKIVSETDEKSSNLATNVLSFLSMCFMKRGGETEGPLERVKRLNEEKIK